tara:strand:- start:852 stop:1022 length:171 start_codon:yes stop_codon:yes gene_type:complete
MNNKNNYIKDINKIYNTNYKNINGSFNGLIYFVIKLDNDLLYYNKNDKSIIFKLNK